MVYLIPGSSEYFTDALLLSSTAMLLTTGRSQPLLNSRDVNFFSMALLVTWLNNTGGSPNLYFNLYTNPFFFLGSLNKLNSINLYFIPKNLPFGSGFSDCSSSVFKSLSSFVLSV